VKKVEGYTLFFSERDPFSNWFRCDFTVKGISFNCGEQYMMYAKARLFDDLDMAERILAAVHPKEQKALGRKIRGFDEATWEERRLGILRAGLLEKFRQNDEIGQLLLSTQGTILVEASPYDRIWGVGLGASDPKIIDPKNWRGSNLLGQVLMQIRNDLLSWKYEMKTPQEESCGPGC
jgi:ribA/ribD-fused uncharacterized protein